LAIICNVSNIQRKPVLEDFDESRSHVHEKSETSVLPSMASDGEGNTKLRSASGPNSPVALEEVHSQEEDPNLFDEATISLVDRHDTGVEARPRAGADESNAVNLESDAESLETSQITVDLETTSRGTLVPPSLSFAKSKNKRKIIPKRDPHQPVVVVLDSLGGTARSGAVRALKDWIAEEGKSKRGMEAIIKEKGYYPKGTQIPMQNNWTDCGVYLLGYVEKFFQNPDEFMHKLLTGSMSAQEDWPELDPSAIRHKMREIIFECHKQQEEVRKAQKKAKKESTKSKMTPDPTAQPTTKVDTKTKNELEQHVGDAEEITQAEPSTISPPPKLGSPFEPEKERTGTTKHSSKGGTAKDPDSPSTTKSSIKPTPPVGSNMPSRRHSPEVRIGKSTVQSHRSVVNAHTGASRPPKQKEQTDENDDAPHLSNLNKRRRQDNHSHPTGSPDTKRPQTDPSWQKKRDGNSEVKALSSRSREGSAPNVPIEIEDSQEVEVADSGLRPSLQPGVVTHHRPPSHVPRPTQPLQPSPSFEEIPRPVLQLESQKHRYRGTSTDV
jgi:sentrin-specific protease 7